MYKRQDEHDRLCVLFLRAYEDGRNAWALPHIEFIADAKDWRARLALLERLMPKQFIRPIIFEEESLQKWLYSNFSGETAEKIKDLMEADVINASNR